jgi:5,10-methylenetetrahydromethanopterin reductase
VCKAIFTPPPGPAAGCSPKANRPTVRVRWRKPSRAPRSSCTGRPILTWEGWQNTPPPQVVAAEVAGYVEMARRYEPADARYLTNHRGHFVFVKPEERKFVSAELIRRTTFTATEQALKQRVEALREAGWRQLVIAITPGEERAIEDWACVKRAFD